MLLLRLRRSFGLAALVGTLLHGLPVFGAESQTNIFSPQSAPARSIVAVSHFTLAITGLIFAVVGGFLLSLIVPFRQRDNDGGSEPPQIFGSTQIELSWTII